MNKNDYENIIAKVVCNKDENIAFDMCYSLSSMKACKNQNKCRITEKTEEQLEYILSPIDKNVYLEACAGSGKTEVVALKTAYEINKWKYKNRGIAVLTFTNNATDVIKNRVNEFLGLSSIYPHYIGTFSSFVHNYIVQPFGYKYVAYEGKDGDYSLTIVDEDIEVRNNPWLNNYKCEIPYVYSQKNDSFRYQDIYAHQIGFDISRKDYYIKLMFEERDWLYNYYKKQCFRDYLKRYWNLGKIDYENAKNKIYNCKHKFNQSGFITFEDMNIIAAKVLNSSIGSIISKRFPIIIVDECQDLSPNELEILKLLIQKGSNVHYIGDLNQSIYEFKLVDPKYIEEHIYKNISHKYTLTENFRSCRTIVEFSEKLINRNAIVKSNINGSITTPLIYIESDNQKEIVNDYVKILKLYGLDNKKNAILVKQNKLLKSLKGDFNEDSIKKNPLITALQLWMTKTPEKMKVALEYAGIQISKFFGGGTSKTYYYKPLMINSVINWKIFLNNILNDMVLEDKLINFKQTYGQWYNNAKDILNKIIKNNYFVIQHCDLENRDIDNIIKKNDFKTPKNYKTKNIINVNEAITINIPIHTIHASKGCTYDTTLVLSSSNTRSKGGHWKNHWINGEGELIRIGYVANTRARSLLVWGVPKLIEEDRKLLEGYGFVNSKEILQNKTSN